MTPDIHIFAAHTSDWQPLVDLVEPYWQEYADRHGYKLAIAEMAPDRNDHFSFVKTQGVANYIRSYGDNGGPNMLWVIDLDMLPTNMTRGLMVPNIDGWAIAMTKDINGWNSGSYVLNLSIAMAEIYALTWLDSVAAMRSVVRSEQDAMQLLNGPFCTVEMPHPSINSIDYNQYPAYAHLTLQREQGNWHPEDFVVHLPGMTMEDRLRILPTYLPHIVR